MENYHHLKSLAPRDVVARAIDEEMKKSGAKHVYLDMTHLDAEFIKERFPNIYSKTLSFGIDMTKDFIPVVPAAHYTCGGVVVDKTGESSINHLFVIGEASFTGLHGANRLASNSLLEGLVYGESAANKATLYFDKYQEFSKVPEWKTGEATMSEEVVLVSHAWNEIRTLMWNYVGIVRSDKRLNRALERVRLIKDEVNEYYWSYLITADLIELKNIVEIAELIILSAKSRKESRGLHTTLDYKDKDPNNFLHDTYLRRTVI
jgi:L-aspartate oxidase